MSVAEAATLPVARRISPRFLASELHLIFGRRRNWAGLAVLAAVPILIAVAVKVAAPKPGEGGPDFFNQITANGLFVALAALTVEMPLFLPLAVSAIAGDTIAGEANLGTLRYLLAVPVHRTRLLVVKYTAVLIFSFAATFLVAVVGGVIGVALFGGGHMTLLSGTQVGMSGALGRTVLATLYLAVCFASLGAVGLFISTLTEQPIGATIAVLIINILSFILDSIPQISWLHPYLISHWWTAYGDFFRDPITYDAVRHGLFVAAAYIAIFWLAAWARFASKDVTS